MQARHHGDRVRRGPGRLQDRADPTRRLIPSARRPGRRHRPHRCHRPGARGQDRVRDVAGRQPAGGRGGLAGLARLGGAAGRPPAGRAAGAGRRRRGAALRRRCASARAGGRPAGWPARTGAVSLLALQLTLPRTGLAAALPPRSCGWSCWITPASGCSTCRCSRRVRGLVGGDAAAARGRDAAGRSCASSPGCPRAPAADEALAAPGTGCTATRCTACATGTGLPTCSPAAS